MNKRFEKQTTLIGKNAQEKLRSTKIGIVGLGGIGGPAIIALTYAGISNFVLIDYDTIDVSNLNRQILFKDNDIGRFKTEVACLSCIFPKNIKKNENIQVLSPSVMMIGAIMANQAIKAILYPEKVIPGELILIDLFNLNIEKIHTERNPQCPVCGTISE